MFGKLIANLPFNPSMITQVSFYARRMRQEKTIRRFGFAFVAVSLLVQMFAALYPAQKSLAASPNHILNGVTTKTSILKAWDANTGNLQAIYAKFGVTRANIAAISGENPNATVVSTAHDFWSIGRLPLTNFGISGVSWGERTVDVGGTAIYERPLHAWDTGPSSSYKAFRGTNQFGVDFWILQDCGNLTFKGAYLPKEPKPALSIHKTLLTPVKVKPGDEVKFRVEYQNTVSESLATDFNVTDSLDANFEFIGSTPGLDSRSGNMLVLGKGKQLGYSATPYARVLNVKVKAGVKDGTVICNQAKASSSQSSASSERPCVTVSVRCTVPGKENLSPTDIRCATPAVPAKPCPTNSAVLATDPSCGQCPAGQSRQSDNSCKLPEADNYCIATTGLAGSDGRSLTTHTKVYLNGNTGVTGYTYDLGSDGTIDATSKNVGSTDDKTFTNLTPGRHSVTVGALLVGSAGQKISISCSTEITVSEAARVIQSKSVSDVTQNKTDANGFKVNNGDELVFTLTTQNVTGTDYSGYKGQDYFGDILDYADVADPAELSSQGISLDANRYLNWTETIAASSTSKKTIHVRVKAVTPTTNRPSNASEDYDCTLSNKYGNEVTMTIGCPLVKNIETVTGTIPNTGPGTTLLAGFGLTTFVGYFFSRSRLLSKELDLIRLDYAGTGGM